MTFETFLALVVLTYMAQGALLLFGLRRGRDALFDVKPRVSIVIAARNEEEHIEASLRSACSQSYPADHYEVILVNDGSTDQTGAIAARVRADFPGLKIIDAAPEGPLRGKVNALVSGIDYATGEVIMITDADCTVPVTWVEATSRRFGPGVGLVGGMTLQKALTPFEGLQSVDWAYILGLASASASISYPLGSIGNNLSFRKAAYEDVGGYRKLKFSVTEDYTLVQAIIKSGKWQYLYPIDPDVLVESTPCPDVVSLIRQKQRWGKGGLDMRLGGLMVLVIGFLMHTAPFVMLFWNGVMQAAAAIIVKIVVDYMFLYQVLRRLKRIDELRYFYWFELYFFIYVVALPFLVLFGGKVHWKGRTF